jgi:hypothetical protein
VKPASIAAALAWATGAWASFGVVAVTSQSITARAGLLPPLWLLAVLAVAAVLVVSALPLSRDEAAPLWLALVSWLPWIPGPILTGFLVFDGPLSRVVVFVAAAIVIGRSALRVHNPQSTTRNTQSVAVNLVAAFVIAALASGLAAWRLAPILPNGDEPHYLVITQSLLYDGDLQIENNHRRGDYMVYADRDLKPDYLKRGQNGQIYSIHAPGVSALVLPAFALGGYPGVVVFLALLFGAAGALTWRAAYKLTGDATSSWVGWAGVVLSAPTFFHSFTVYPDGPAALIVIGATSFLLAGQSGRSGQSGLSGRSDQSNSSPWEWSLVGTTIAALPWLHTRLAVVAVALLAVLAVRAVSEESSRSGGSARSVVALLAVPVISFALWLTFFHVIYGTIDPRAPYGGRGESLADIPRGLTGLIVDQQFGLLPNAPIFGLALAGLATLWRMRRRFVVELAAIAVPYVLVVSANEMWWAGFSAPARFLVPVLLPLALPLAAWWQRHDGRVPRAFAIVALGASLAITATLAWTGRGALVYNGHDGYALWLDLLAPAVSLARAEPSVFRGALGATWMQTAIWIGIAMACWWGMRLAGSWLAGSAGSAEPKVGPTGARTGVWILTSGAAMSAALVLAVQLSWTLGAGPVIETGSSELRLLAAACEPHLQSTVAHRTLVVPDASRRPPAPNRALWSGHNVAAGRYDLVLDAIGASTGTLTVALGRPDVIVATCDVAAVEPGSSACAIDLPAGAEALWIQDDARLRQSVSSVGLALDTPPSPGACDLRARRAIVDGTQVLYVTDGLVYAKPHGVWVLGGAAGQFVASGTGSTKLRLQNGPVQNHITIRTVTWREDWDAQPGAFLDVEIPRPGAGEEPEFTIAATAGFESSAVDPGIRGHRSLGVWVSLQDFGKRTTSYSVTDPSRTISDK